MSEQLPLLLYSVLQGRRLRLRSPERIVDELETLQRDFGIRSVHLPMLLSTSRRTISGPSAKEILRRGLEVGWTGFSVKTLFRKKNWTSTVRRVFLLCTFPPTVLQSTR